MIIQAKCECGNDNPSKFKYYDGCLGYEAIVCCICGRYADHQGNHLQNKWSLDYINLKGKDVQHG